MTSTTTCTFNNKTCNYSGSCIFGTDPWHWKEQSCVTTVTGSATTAVTVESINSTTTETYQAVATLGVIFMIGIVLAIIVAKVVERLT